MPGHDGWCRTARPRLKWRRRHCWLPQKCCRLTIYWGCFVLECWYHPGVGLYPWRSRRTDYPNRPPVVYPMVSAFMKKRTATASPAPGDGPKHSAPILSTNFAKLPNIVLHCSVTRYDDGDPRVPGWLSIKTQGSAWVVTLKDPDTGTMMQCLGNTLDDALALADLMAGSEDAPWEIDQWAKRQAPKKKA